MSDDLDLKVKALLPAEIVSALERGATVVTSNQRAARTLRRDFDRRNRALGLKRWQPAKVLAWDAWVSGWWSGLVMDGQADAMLLNRSQELAMWRSVIEADRERESLRTVESLSELAAEAWGLLCSYGGQSRPRELATTANTQAFKRWAMEFERRCRAVGLMARGGLEEALRKSIATEEIKSGVNEIILVGFDALTPSLARLIEALRGAATTVEESRLDVAGERRVLMGAADEGEELRVCAQWVRKFLETHPDARVGVIVPGLAGQRAEIDRVFREVLAPELEDIRAGSAVPYEFSVGATLAATPMVAAALDLLGWARGALPLERVSGLLLSPYFAGGREGLGARAEFDAFVLRQQAMLRPEVSLEALIDLVEKTQGLGVLMVGLRRMRAVIARDFAKDDAQTYGEWAEAMRELLSAAGWGGGDREDSIEFQTRAKWESVLDELATLDFDGKRVKFGEALDEVVQVARRTIFAPESREAPVLVMGPLEAAGSRFDAIWFLRAGELSWPMKVSSNPLLPWAMQRELGMPGVDVARDAAFARHVTERIAESAKTVICSYAEESSDGRQRASKALQGLLFEDVDARDLVPQENAREVLGLETIADIRAVAGLPDEVLRGGANVLELQAACGFRAFVEHRLWSTEVDRVELGMDARESGSVVHRVLESFWGQVQTQADLKAMTAMERIFALDEAIEIGIARTASVSSTVWDVAYIEMQRERLRRLLSPWIAQELKRPEFVVKALEKKLPDVTIGPLRLSVRVDRVDETAGGEVVIDYKTGRTEARDWLSQRPDAPQLPLYAVLAEEELAGVAFGMVRAGKNMGWKYAASDTSVLGGAAGRPVKMEAGSFVEQVELWRSVLTELATQFAAGDARVDPKWFPNTCEHCVHRILCRVNPVEVEEMDDEEIEVGFE